MHLHLSAEEILSHPPADADTPGGRLLGTSRQGRPIRGFLLGHGPVAVSLIAGCHADEPVGPAMLGRLTSYLATLPPAAPELAAATWHLVPHANPDGAAANAGWASLPPLGDGYPLAAYLAGVVREAPGDDVEFGFPRGAGDAGARPENRAVAAFLAGDGPYHLHASFHGMAFAAGPWFLMEEGWVKRTGEMREALRRRVREMGYTLHDVDRGGEKGFFRIDRGFTTRPDSRAMRRHFLDQGDADTAELFRPSSMEYVRSLGGDPLTLVSEMPLFLYPEKAEADDDPPLPTEPGRVYRFAAWARHLLTDGGPEALERAAAERGIRPMPVGDQMRLQLAYLEAGLAAAG